MRTRLATAVGVLAGALLAGCASHSAFGPSSDARLDSAVKDGANDNAMKDVTIDQVSSKSCGDYRGKLTKAQNDEAAEVDRLGAFESLYKELKDKNDYLEQALSSNPDLQFANDSQVPKIRDECRDALADVTKDYSDLVNEIADLLVVKDTHGNPAPRLDFKKFREAITVLNPDDRDALLARVDQAERKIKAASN